MPVIALSQLYQFTDESFRISGQSLERAMAIDPNGLNTRISLVITYFQERRYADALPILSGLLEDLPDNPQVLRMAVQAGKWGDAPEVAERALELIQRHDPANAKAARGFLYGKDGTKGSGAPL